MFRRGVPFVGRITALVGPNGSGKSLGAAELVVLPALRSGIKVVSPVRVDPEAVGLDPALYVPLTDVSQVGRVGVYNVEICTACGAEDEWCGCGAPIQVRPKVDANGDVWSITNNEPAVLWLDEINALFPSRQTLDVPVEVQRLMNQFRKPKVRVVITAPAWGRIDKVLREVVQVVVTCDGYKADKWLRDSDGEVLRDADGGKMRPNPAIDWPSYRAFDYAGWDASEFDEFSLDDTRSLLEPLWTRRYHRNSMAGQWVYDTGQQIQLLSGVLEHTGSCVNCGGSKRRPTCSCEKTHRKVSA
jgi:hypothetical protein